jgi:hypothetical protein
MNEIRLPKSPRSSSVRTLTGTIVFSGTGSSSCSAM